MSKRATTLEDALIEIDALKKAQERTSNEADKLEAEQDRLRAALKVAHKVDPLERRAPRTAWAALEAEIAALRAERDRLKAIIEAKDYKISLIEKELARLRGLPNVGRLERICDENDRLRAALEGIMLLAMGRLQVWHADRIGDIAQALKEVEERARRELEGK
jgi:hypothetical protein